MQLRSKDQSEENAARDSITAAMETGNHKLARDRWQAIREVHFDLSESIRLDVLADYGISL